MITLNSLNEFKSIKQSKVTALQAKERELETLKGKALNAQEQFAKAVNEGIGHEKAYKAKQEADRAVEEMEEVVKVYAEAAKTKVTPTQELIAASGRVFKESTEMMFRYENRKKEIGKQLAELTKQYNDLASEYMVIQDNENELEGLSDFIQRYGNLNFTLSLVELPIYKIPSTGQIIITPRIIAKTKEIERIIYQISDEKRSVVEEAESKTITTTFPMSETIRA